MGKDKSFLLYNKLPLPQNKTSLLQKPEKNMVFVQTTELINTKKGEYVLLDDC